MKKILILYVLSMAFLPVRAQESLQKNRAKTDSIQAVFKARIDSIEQNKLTGTRLQTGAQKTDSARAAFTSKIDSLKQSIPGDSLGRAGLKKVDSVQSAFYNSVDSLQAVYQKPLSSLDAESTKLQHKIDSLQTLKLPATGFTRKLDSIQNLRTQKVVELNAGMDKLKGKAMKPLKEVTLPPQMQEPLDKLTNSITTYKMPDKGFNLPGIPGKASGIPNLGKLPGTEGVNVPGIENAKLPGGISPPGEIKGLTTNMNKLGEVTGKMGSVTQTMTQAGGYADDAKNMAQGNFDEVKHVDKAVESQVMKLDGASELQKGTGEIGKLKQTASLAQNPDSLKDMGIEKAKQESIQYVQREATNHFAGHEQVLQQAMDKMSKLKNKYTDVKSITDLTKRPPNPLKGKPFIERIVPGLTFQIQRSSYFLLDVNALAMYRIYPHWSAGTGWNTRLAIDDWKVFSAKVYGPRAAIEFKWKKGINLLFAPELMNTLTPQSTDPNGRGWVWSAYAGVKKDFTVYKTIKGNTQILYNFYNSNNTSPYADRLGIRFGFEFPMKKKRP